MKFYVDQSLGKLIKWLRLLGFDTHPVQLHPRGSTQLPPRQPEVYFLTQQTSWPARERRPDLLILTSQDPEEQLAEICQRLQLAPETWLPLQRCSTCNLPLQPLPPDRLEGRVPDYIAASHQQFLECPRCQRVFWEGSHQRRIRRRLEELAHRQTQR
ncbi:MAG: Mut7-C RNAse domain-containing protein [Desulfobacca sp.]|uniref:Mut7-C RNAse domain-containing protein n=1 Tax=Desulfobacca sp. TaxID=2067990 RepID=UPI00404927CC